MNRPQPDGSELLLEVQRLAIELAGRVLLDVGVPVTTARARLVALHAQDVDAAASEAARAHARACVEVADRCLDVERSVRAVASRLRTLHGPGVRASTLAYVALVARGTLEERDVRAALREPARVLGLEEVELDAILAKDAAALVDPDVAAALERLGVGADDTEEALRTAYRAAARAHHPDRHTQAGLEATDAAREEMARVNIAHARLQAWLAAGRPRRAARPAGATQASRAPADMRAPPGAPRLRGWHVALLATVVLGGGWLSTLSEDVPTAIEAAFSGPGTVDVRCGAHGGSGHAVRLHLPAATTCAVRDPEVAGRHAVVLVDRSGRWRCFGGVPGCARDGAR